jgi:hypothetical protein
MSAPDEKLKTKELEASAVSKKVVQLAGAVGNRSLPVELRFRTSKSRRAGTHATHFLHNVSGNGARPRRRLNLPAHPVHRASSLAQSFVSIECARAGLD